MSDGVGDPFDGVCAATTSAPRTAQPTPSNLASRNNSRLLNMASSCVKERRLTEKRYHTEEQSNGGRTEEAFTPPFVSVSPCEPVPLSTSVALVTNIQNRYFSENCISRLFTRVLLTTP